MEPMGAEGLPFAALVAARRRQLGLSGRMTARRMRAAAAAEHEGCSAAKQTISDYEHGRHLPNPDGLRWLAAALELPVSDLITAAEAQRMNRRELLRNATVIGGAFLVPDAAPRQQAAERSLLTRLGHESARFGQHIESSNVGPATLEDLEQDIDRIASDYLTQPALPLIDELAYLRNRVFELLDGHQHLDQSRGLYLLGGKLCGLLASASSDRFGRYDAAAKHARTAWLCAGEAGDNELKAWVCSVRSTIDFWLGRYQKAADRALEGRAYVRGGIELVRLASLEARARARLGDAGGVNEAVHLADRARDAIDDEDEQRHVGIFAFPEANQIRCAGSALLWLGDPDSLEAAGTHLERSLRLFEAGTLQQSYAHIAVTRVDLAIVHLKRGRLDAAANTLRPVLALPADHRLNGVVRRCGELRRLLTAPRYKNLPLAQELLQAIEEFRRSNVIRQAAGAIAAAG